MAKLNRDWIVEPHGPLTQLTDRIWTAEGTFAIPLGRFPRRMTLIELEGGGSAIWSAIPLGEVDMARIEALGPVRYLIVPNQAHRLDLPAWHLRYPTAKVIAPPSAREAVFEAAPVSTTHDIIADPAIGFELVAGTKADEFALLVEEEDGITLVLNDILANVRHPHGIAASLITRVFGYGARRPRTSRPVRRLFLRDSVALARQFRTWAAIDGLRRIIVSHGDVIDRDPAAALERAARDLD